MKTIQKLLLLFGIVLADFFLILVMRKITPNIFALRVTIIACLALGSILIYFLIVKPLSWVRESLFVASVMAMLTIGLTIILHKFIENNLSAKNFIVTAIAAIIPFLCGGIYRLTKTSPKNTGSSLS